jgi:hypothetical protein
MRPGICRLTSRGRRVCLHCPGKTNYTGRKLEDELRHCPRRRTVREEYQEEVYTIRDTELDLEEEEELNCARLTSAV